MKAVRFSRAELLAVTIGGALGSACRAFVAIPSASLAEAIPVLPPSIWANLPGTVLLALLHLARPRFREPVGFFAMVGFCGSFTTVSGFSLEVILQLQERGLTAAVTTLVLPVASTCLLVHLILKTGRHLP